MNSIDVQNFTNTRINNDLEARILILDNFDIFFVSNKLDDSYIYTKQN